MKYASHYKYTYFHIISGEDIPIKSISFFNDFFVQMTKYISIKNKKNGKKDLCAIIFFVNGNPRSKLWIKANHISLTIQYKTNMLRKRIGKLDQIYKGLVYGSLPYDAVMYTLNYIKKNKQFLFDLSLTFIPEEFFFQTILMNSPLKDRITGKSLRYCEWSIDERAEYLDDNSIHDVFDCNCVFGRKVDYTHSSNLIEQCFNVYDE